MKKYVTEFIGTFFLVLLVGLTLGVGTMIGYMAPLAVGLGLAALVYMGKDISGAHYNPAITLGVLITGQTKMDIKEGGFFWLAQFLGAVMGGLVGGILVMDQSFVFQIAPVDNATVVQVLLIEMLFTFMLTLVYLQVTMGKSGKKNAYYGLAIGCTYLAARYAGEDISGGVLNPALGTGPNLIHQGFEHIWLYIVGPLVGGALAGFVYKYLNE